MRAPDAMGREVHSAGEGIPRIDASAFSLKSFGRPRIRPSPPIALIGSSPFALFKAAVG
jgi:hypothetical protein